MPPVLSKCQTDWPCSACLQLKCIFARYSTGDTCVASFTELNGETLIVLDSPDGVCPADLPTTSSPSFWRENFTAEMTSAIFNAGQVLLSAISLVGLTYFSRWFRKWALRMEESSLETQSLLVDGLANENPGEMEEGREENFQSRQRWRASDQRRSENERERIRIVGGEAENHGNGIRNGRVHDFPGNHRAAANALQDRRRNLLEDYGQNDVGERGRTSPIFGGLLQHFRLPGVGRRANESGYSALLGNSTLMNATSTPPRAGLMNEERGPNPFSSTPMPQVHAQQNSSSLLVRDANPPPIPPRQLDGATAGPSNPNHDLLQITGRYDDVSLDSDGDENITQVENVQSVVEEPLPRQVPPIPNSPRSRYGRLLKPPQRLGLNQNA